MSAKGKQPAGSDEDALSWLDETADSPSKAPSPVKGATGKLGQAPARPAAPPPAAKAPPPPPAPRPGTPPAAKGPAGGKTATDLGATAVAPKSGKFNKPTPPPPPPEKPPVEEDFQDALDFLTQTEPEGGAEGSGEGAGLDWLGGEEEAATGAPALTTEEEEDPEGANVSIFSTALDDFFQDLEQKPGAQPVQELDEGAQTIVTGRRRPRKRAGAAADPRVDKVMSTLVRYLTRKDVVRESQLDTIYRLTVGKLVEPLSAEVVVVYALDDNKQATFAHLFYSKSLFKNHPGLEERFTRSLDKLGQTKISLGQGVVGKSMEQKKSITTLDARNEREFENHLGKATGFEVRTAVTIPISDAEFVYGAIQVMNKDPQSGEEFFSYQDMRLLEEVGGYMGRLIHIAKDPELERTDKEIAGYYARMTGSVLFDCTGPDVIWDDRLWEVVGMDAIQKFEILPLKKLDSKTLQVAMCNPLDQPRRSSFEAATDLQIGEVMVSTESQIKQVIEAKFKKAAVQQGDLDGLSAELGGDAERVDVADTDSDEENSPIIKLVNRIIEDAYSRGASDIHIEPFESGARVRYRVDGDLQERMQLPLKAINAIMSRIKIMCNLDIAERRLPQDGKIKFKRFSKRGLDIDLRVATGPMTFGEKCVMRLLSKGSISLGLDAMGFADQNLAKYRWGCKQPYGMMLNVGPTGSGKTTTLYSGLSEVNDISVNIQTAEDPVEYPLHGINQMQMNKDIGLTFATALKCYLRMDPDIILVGEIRDLETAEIAIEASLTGHLLFSTLHTNDAAGTVSRFVEMGIEPFMVSSSLLVCCAQRLLRRVCDKCRKEWKPDDRQLKILQRDPRPFLDGKPMYIHNENKKAGDKACQKCGGAGYKGRIGTHEVLTLNDELRELINKEAASDVLKEAATRNGMLTIYQDALFKVKQGVTDLEDVLINVRADEVKGQRQDEVGL